MKMNITTLMVCFIVIITGIFASISLIGDFTATGYSYGTINKAEQYKNYVFQYKTKSLNLVSDPSGEDRYTFSTTLDPVSFDGLKNNVTMDVNGAPCSEFEYGAGYVNASLIVEFLGLNGEVLFKDTLHIRINYYATKTDLVIYTDGGYVAVGYWQQYSAGGFVVNISYMDKEVKIA